MKALGSTLVIVGGFVMVFALFILEPFLKSERGGKLLVSEIVYLRLDLIIVGGILFIAGVMIVLKAIEFEKMYGKIEDPMRSSSQFANDSSESSQP